MHSVYIRIPEHMLIMLITYTELRTVIIIKEEMLLILKLWFGAQQFIAAR